MAKVNKQGMWENVNAIREEVKTAAVKCFCNVCGNSAFTKADRSGVDENFIRCPKCFSVIPYAEALTSAHKFSDKSQDEQSKLVECYKLLEEQLKMEQPNADNIRSACNAILRFNSTNFRAEIISALFCNGINDINKKIESYRPEKHLLSDEQLCDVAAYLIKNMDIEQKSVLEGFIEHIGDAHKCGELKSQLDLMCARISAGEFSTDIAKNVFIAYAADGVEAAARLAAEFTNRNESYYTLDGIIKNSRVVEKRSAEERIKTALSNSKSIILIVTRGACRNSDNNHVKTVISAVKSLEGNGRKKAFPLIGFITQPNGCEDAYSSSTYGATVCDFMRGAVVFDSVQVAADDIKNILERVDAPEAKEPTIINTTNIITTAEKPRAQFATKWSYERVSYKSAEDFLAAVTQGSDVWFSEIESLDERKRLFDRLRKIHAEHVTERVGYFEAATALYRCYIEGYGCTADSEAANRILPELMAENYPPSLYAMAQKYYVIGDYKSAKKKLEQCGKAYAPALWLLGRLALGGKDGIVDYFRAAKKFEEAADLDYAPALNDFAISNYYGTGVVAKNEKYAVTLLTRSITLGDVEATAIIKNMAEKQNKYALAAVKNLNL